MATVQAYVRKIGESDTSYFIVYADISWDNNNPYYITVRTYSSSSKYYKWEISGRYSQGDYTKYITNCPANSTQTFYGAPQTTKDYIFQVAGDGGETVGEYGNAGAASIFTVTFNSGSGGGGSGGDYVQSYTLTYYDANGQTYQKSSHGQGEIITIRSSGPSKGNSNLTSGSYTISADANEGTFPSNAVTSIQATKETYISYTLVSWNTNRFGAGTSYSFGQTINMPGYNLDLYPQYSGTEKDRYSNNSLSRLTTPNPPSGSTTATYTATFDPNGGSVNTVSQSVNATISKTFAGWTTSKNGTTTVSSLDYQGTVYAKWGNKYANNTVVLPLPSRSGYNFKGWSTSKSGTSLKGAGATVAITSDTTFYAFWTEKEKPTGGIFIHDGTKWQLATEYVFNEETWISSE